MTSSSSEPSLDIGWFSARFGHRQRTPESISGFDSLCAARGLSPNLSTMGCETFWEMTEPVESYVVSCLEATLAARGVALEEVDHVVFATSDKNLRHLNQDFATSVMARVGLTACVPTLISMQQCASSIAALDYACRLFVRPEVRNAAVVALDFVVDEAERILPFALFGDAVTSCMISREAKSSLSLLAYGASVDFSGLLGKDDFNSRKRVASTTLASVLGGSDVALSDLKKCFSTNFFKPIAVFNSMVCGINRSQLCVDTLGLRAHCGNCDWMMNLMHHQENGGLPPGPYLIQSFAPGFFACGLLEARA